MKTLAFLFLALSLRAVAGPPQIDVMGLVPGITTEAQVSARSFERLPTDSYPRIEIGGRRLPCDVMYMDGRLAQMNCFTGNRGSSWYTKASNTEVFLEHLQGFSEKFGKPDVYLKDTMRTRNGVEHERLAVQWIDAVGNSLAIVSVFGTIDAGMLTLTSAAYHKKQETDTTAEQAKRKF